MTTFDGSKINPSGARRESGQEAGTIDGLDLVVRKIVNIERQHYYGEKSPNRRLKQIRDVIQEAVKKKADNEIQKN